MGPKDSDGGGNESATLTKDSESCRPEVNKVSFPVLFYLKIPNQTPYAYSTYIARNMIGLNTWLRLDDKRFKIVMSVLRDLCSSAA